MNKKLYVGSLPYSITEAELREAFAPYGTLESARVITDKFTGRSKGFGFVEMSTEEGAQKALDAMNGKEMGGRNLMVSEAKPEQPRAPRGGGAGFGGGGGYGDRPPRRDLGRRESKDRGDPNRSKRRGGEPGPSGGGNAGGGFDDDNFGNR